MKPFYRDCFPPFLRPGERLIIASEDCRKSALPFVAAGLRTSRNWRLMRLEQSIIAHQTSLGAHACDRDEALGRLTAAAAGRRPAATPAT